MERILYGRLLEASYGNLMSEETFALIVRRVVEARRIAANGGGLSMNRDSEMMQSVVSNPVLGTRRAMTAPLSPLTGGREKEMGFPDQGGGGKGSKGKEFWGKLICWR